MVFLVTGLCAGLKMEDPEESCVPQIEKLSGGGGPP